MNSDWSGATLGDVCRVTKGATYRGEHVGAGDDGLVSITSIRPGGGFIPAGVRAFSGPRRPHQEVETGDIVVALTDLTQTGNLIGSPARVPPMSFARLVAAHHVARIQLDSGLDGHFAYYRLLARDFNLHAARYATGTTVRQVKPSDLERFEFRLPPVEEQRRIAGVLGALDAKIEHNRSIERRLSETLGSMFKLQLLGTSWELAPLGDQVEVIMGQSPPGTTYSDDPASGLPLVQGMAAFGERFPVSGVFTSAPTKRAIVGDVLMTVRAPVGEINIADREYCAGRGVGIIRGRHPAYTEQLMTFLRSSWLAQESGTIFPSVNRSQIVSMEAPKPIDGAVEDFEGAARGVYDLIAALTRERARLTAIRDGLLPKLVSGRIRVPESYDPDDVLGTVVEQTAAT